MHVLLLSLPSRPEGAFPGSSVPPQHLHTLKSTSEAKTGLEPVLSSSAILTDSKEQCQELVFPALMMV